MKTIVYHLLLVDSPVKERHYTCKFLLQLVRADFKIVSTIVMKFHEFQ